MLRTDCNSHAQACWWLKCIQCCVCCLQQHCCSLPRYQFLTKWEFPTATEAVTHCKVSAVHHGTRTHARTHLSTHMNNWGSQSNQVNMHISRIGEGKEKREKTNFVENQTSITEVSGHENSQVVSCAEKPLNQEKYHCHRLRFAVFDTWSETKRPGFCLVNLCHLVG